MVCGLSTAACPQLKSVGLQRRRAQRHPHLALQLLEQHRRAPELGLNLRVHGAQLFLETRRHCGVLFTVGGKPSPGMDAAIESLLDGLSDDEVQGAPPAPAPAPSQVGSAPPNASLDAQISAEFAELAALYGPRLPVLNERGLNVEQYLAVVKILGNGSVDAAAVEPALQRAVGRDQSLVLVLHLSSKGARALPEPEFARVQARADTLSALLAQKQEQLAALEAQAAALPNLTALVAAPTAAKLLAKTGGLARLAATPPANLVSVRASPLLDEPLIREVPEAQKRPALRILAAKVVLAARVDAARPELGRETARWQRSVRDRIARLLAPPPSLQQRSLPKPVDRRASRRGGQKLRKRRQRRAAQTGQPEILPFGKDQ